MRQLPIEPEEAFVLSRVDGVGTAREIAAATGLTVDRVGEVLQRLERLGALEYEGDAQRTGPSPSAASSSGARAMAGTSSDPPELHEDVEIPFERRRVILDLFARLDSLNHYALLGLDQSCERREVRNAYYEVVNIFHPDRYYGKHLGSYAPKLDRLFERITHAYEVLSRNDTRTDYDERLRLTARAPSAARRVSGGKVFITTKPQQPVDTAPQHPEPTSVSRPSTAGGAAEAAAHDQSAGAASSAGAQQPTPSRPAAAARTRREAMGANSPASSQPPRSGPDALARARAFARRLSGPALGPDRSSPPPPVRDREELKEQVTGSLKRLYAQRLERQGNPPTQDYLARARQALADADPVSALNMLKIAATVDPTNAELQEQVVATEKQALAAMADTYARQAKTEERDGQLQRAAEHYEKAARGRDSAELFDRAANCLLESGGDLHHAGDSARRAVALDPNRVAYRITLSRIYVAAGMRKSAIGEIERALAQAPDDRELRAWLKKVKREKA